MHSKSIHSGSGIVAVNPPWTLAERFNVTIPGVSVCLASDGKSRCRQLQLVAE